MNWDRIDSTVRQAFRHNRKDLVVHRGPTPLSDLIAKDPVPDVAAMTEAQLCEYAADHHIAIAEGLTREELVEAILSAAEVNWEQRLQGMTGLLDYVFADGPHPLAVFRRWIAVVKAIRPDLCYNMSCAQLAILCDDGKGRSSDGRGTVSARIKRLYEQPIRRAGMRGCKAPFQKDQSASEAYHAAQLGNKNRHGSKFLMELKLSASNGANGKTLTKRKA